MPDTQRVIFVDPGQRAGWASATIGLNRFEDVAHGVFTLKDMAEWLCDVQRIGSQFGVAPHVPPFDVIGYETWRLRPDKANAMVGDDFQPSQLIGMIRLIGWLSGAKLVGYGPELKFSHPELPESLQQRIAESSEEHDKDAIMLLWHYFYTQWFDPTQEPG